MCPNLTVLWIVHSWLSSLRFSLTFICQCLLIVHSWSLLQSRVPKVDSALDCPFLIVVPSVFSNVYLSVSLDCPFLIAPSISCVQSWQCSGLSILDCSFNLVYPKLTVLWIVHSWLLLQSRVYKVNSDLDCPFLIAPSMSCAQSWECSELSILDCSFNLVCLKLRVLWIVHSWLSLRFSLTFIFQLLWIVHSWLLLQSRVPNVDSALDCPFLIVVPSVFSNVYLSVSLDCPFLIAPSILCAQGWQCSGLSILDCSFNLVSPKLTVLWIVHSWLLLQFRVSKVDSVSGLSILDCSFNLVCPRLTVLWIVHSWLLLQCRVPKVDSALDCTFLIFPSVFSNVYFSVSLDCPFLIAPSISCAQGWQCSGLSILDCSFNLVCPKWTVLWIVHSWLSSLRFSLTFICQCLWIVHSWLLLQSRVPKVDSALDCPFLIAPSISCVQS